MIYGLQRSGTNYLTELVKTNFKDVEFHYNDYARSLPVHKHFRLHQGMQFIPEPKYLNNFSYNSFTEFDTHFKELSGLNKVNYLVVMKEPYSWYISYVKMAKKAGWPNFMPKWINNHFMVDYSLFYRQWYEFSQQAPTQVCFMKYEDLLKQFEASLQAIEQQFGLERTGSDYQNVEKVTNSKRFSLSRRKYYTNKEYMQQYSRDELMVLTENLDKALIQELGYELYDWRNK